MKNLKKDLTVLKNTYTDAETLFKGDINLVIPSDTSTSPCVKFHLFDRDYILDPCPYLKIVAPFVQFILTIVISLFFIFESIKAIREA